MTPVIDVPEPISRSTSALTGPSTNLATLPFMTFRVLERDAWLDVLRDTSFYSGNTNVMDHRVKVLFGLAKNTALGLNLYDTWKVRGFANNYSLTPSTTRNLSAKEYLFQGDVIVKW
jgi:hypothetical protein